MPDRLHTGAAQKEVPMLRSTLLACSGLLMLAACERVLTELGVAHTLHANGAGVEGEWEEVFAAIRRCNEVVHGMGAPRISTTIKGGTRTDREQAMTEKGGSGRGKGRTPGPGARLS